MERRSTRRTVRQSPCKCPFSSMYLSTPGVPPTWCKSSITYRPLGFKSAMNLHRFGFFGLPFSSRSTGGTGDPAAAHGVSAAKPA